MVELPPDCWVPAGFSLTPEPLPNGTQPPAVAVTDPAGTQRLIYPEPGYVPDPSLWDYIREQLGPFRADTVLTPKGREAFGANESTPLGAINRTVFDTLDLGVMLTELAGYGVQAAVVGGLEEARRNDLISSMTAGQARREFNLAALFGLGEMPMLRAGAAEVNGAEILAQAQRKQLQLAAIARAGVVSARLKIISQSGYPFGRVFGALETVWVDDRGAPIAPPWVPPTLQLDPRLARMTAGQMADRREGGNFIANQIYVVNEHTKSGYVIMDSYLAERSNSRQAGPVSRKNTQLANVLESTVIAYLNEAARKYSPGGIFASTPSVPIDLRGKFIKGRLFLDVPVQVKPIPIPILRHAAKLGITIRDFEGKEY